MTPKELAQYLSCPDCYNCSDDEAIESGAKEIEAAIQSAVEEERNTCLHICEGCFTDSMSKEYHEGASDVVRALREYVIHARGEKK